VRVQGAGVEVLEAVAGRVRGVVDEDGGRPEPLGSRVQEPLRGLGEREVYLHALCPDAHAAKLVQERCRGFGVSTHRLRPVE
jgi:hypothetical protein